MEKNDIYRQIESRISNILSTEQGLIIGETSAVSTRMHSINPKKPGIVKALEQDAGQVFYSRSNPHEIVHIDCFHEPGELNHFALRDYVLDKFRSVLTERNISLDLLDYTDIQTGTGGGRLTGNLTYGQKETLRVAHKNHVHVTIYLTKQNYSVLFPIIWLLEQGVITQGFELRKIYKLTIKPFKNQDGSGSAGSSLENYASYTDSKLKQMPKEGKKTSPISEQSRELKDIADMSRAKGDINQTYHMMDDLEKGISKQEFNRKKSNRRLLSYLKQRNMIQEQKGKLHLTLYGQKIKQLLERHINEIEAKLKRLAKDFPRPPRGSIQINKISSPNTSLAESNVHTTGQVSVPEQGEPLDQIAVPETILSGAKRSYLQNSKFQVTPSDIRVVYPKKQISVNICLLVDASGSMAGRRIQEVKFLAEHLLAGGRDKLSVITFQEDEAELKIPFTKDMEKLRWGLFGIKAKGLTPMAKGLEAGKEFLRDHPINKRKSFLVLITDGLPTISKNGEDPFKETLQEAENISEQDIKFTCIGLEPNLKFLKQLSHKTQGSLYVVDELQKESLAHIINKEKVPLS